jgi:hypothetical protein
MGPGHIELPRRKMTWEEAKRIHKREARRVGRGLPYREEGQSDILFKDGYYAAVIEDERRKNEARS